MGDYADNPGMGSGGLARRNKIDSMVDKMAGGETKPNPLPVSQQPGTSQKTHPSAAHVPYRPSEMEKTTKSYGAPVGAPILSGGNK